MMMMMMMMMMMVVVVVMMMMMLVPKRHCQTGSELQTPATPSSALPEQR